jgi:hypothetical protein
VTALGGSLAAHALGIGIVAAILSTRSRVAPAPPAKPVARTHPNNRTGSVATPHREAAIEITLVSTPPRTENAATIAARATAPQRVSEGTRELPGSRESATSSGPGPIADGRGGDTGGLSLHMRGSALRLSDGALDQVLDHPSPPRSVPHVSGKLESAPGGTAVIHDAVTTVTVERDGTAHLHDKPDFDFHLDLPKLSWLRPPDESWRDLKRDLGNTIRAWYRDPYAQMRRATPTELPQQDHVVPGLCERWGDTACQADAPPPPPNPLAHGKLDFTAYLARKFHVGDVYAVRKRALLDDTFDERAARGGEFRGEQLARSAETMRRNLEELWATNTDPAARRAALFELWDECAEGEDPIGAAGNRARAVVIGWIRTHLPPGSPGAFEADEIAKLSAGRSSRQPFVP